MLWHLFCFEVYIFAIGTRSRSLDKDVDRTGVEHHQKRSLLPVDFKQNLVLCWNHFEKFIREKGNKKKKKKKKKQKKKKNSNTKLHHQQEQGHQVVLARLAFFARI